MAAKKKMPTFSKPSAGTLALFEKEYVDLPREVLNDESTLAQWARRAHAYAQFLPAKSGGKTNRINKTANKSRKGRSS